ncbi:sigma-70 family RNA polymerase sigma factor [Haloferula rosea]|uniref:Sigma-70 family RNA polymerase sigma factor n=1 Tax=Haloferula rosea TaxID=490093 RepID=A0A934VG77_9BACT|nr:sigma-70 family RNA polymerase sigma factor [Haloferula rosea]MBK1827330.1 sigma-70 family RNA polymerase sigma factor [Haloferula rosea]
MKTEPAQFVSLLIDHQEIIRSFIITQIPGSPDVRDILQEVNIVLWEKRASFKLGTNFGAWACSIARFKVLEHWRKEARRRGVLVFNDELSTSLADKTQDRDPGLIEEQREALEHCMSKLSEKNRRLLEVRYSSRSGGLEKLTKDTGRTNQSLRVTLFRLRTSLRNCVRSYLFAKGELS